MITMSQSVMKTTLTTSRPTTSKKKKTPAHPSGVEEADEEEEWAAEMFNAAREAQAFVTQAEKQRSEVEKARGIFKKTGGDSKEKRTGSRS